MLEQVTAEERGEPAGESEASLRERIEEAVVDAALQTGINDSLMGEQRGRARSLMLSASDLTSCKGTAAQDALLGSCS